MDTEYYRLKIALSSTIPELYLLQKAIHDQYSYVGIDIFAVPRVFYTKIEALQLSKEIESKIDEIISKTYKDN